MMMLKARRTRTFSWRRRRNRRERRKRRRGRKTRIRNMGNERREEEK